MQILLSCWAVISDFSTELTASLALRNWESIAKVICVYFFSEPEPAALNGHMGEGEWDVCTLFPDCFKFKTQNDDSPSLILIAEKRKKKEGNIFHKTMVETNLPFFIVAKKCFSHILAKSRVRENYNFQGKQDIVDFREIGNIRMIFAKISRQYLKFLQRQLIFSS